MRRYGYTEVAASLPRVAVASGSHGLDVASMMSLEVRRYGWSVSLRSTSICAMGGVHARTDVGSDRTGDPSGRVTPGTAALA